jgi:hypothetical protein
MTFIAPSLIQNALILVTLVEQVNRGAAVAFAHDFR